jgi:hypothetical protein
MFFQRQDLEGSFYSWIEDTKNLFTGVPSRRMFDRRNGNQVLFLINSYGSLLDGFTIQQGKTIEKRIQHDLPETAKSELSVFNWIRYALFPA